MLNQKKLDRTGLPGGEQLGLAVWCQDEAGPFKTEPYAAESWAPAGNPARHPHEHLRNGTAKLLTLLHPATGEVRGKGVVSTTNAVLHPWLQAELTAILDSLPEPPTPLALPRCATCGNNGRRA